ncbi:MAG TPA: outer membrane beta-barrel protein [Flavobacteriaceae bacterium]|nr:outer membrane beta-barrel protein [Flavobacteriaceae bacterium]
MKLKLTITLMLFALINLHVHSQETKPDSKGTVIGKVFFNYHIDETKDVKQSGAFDLQRAYLGYNYVFDDKFSAIVLLDAGKGSAGSDYSVYIKNAKLNYKADGWITLSLGILGLKQFYDQEKFWGYRYIYKSFTDAYGFGSSADLGFTATFKINDKLKMDFLIVNGEGYKKFQDPSGNNRYGANLVYTPGQNWMFKAYYDTMKGIDVGEVSKETTISNITLFAGYKITGHFRIGAEYNLMKNGITYKEPAKGKDLQGLSFYSTYNINEKWNIFGRYDQLFSNKLSGETTDWNYSEDGDTVIGGVEFKPIKGINTSVNYQFTDFKDSSNNNASLIYFNLEFYF